jgi:hypothetical protein
MWRVCSEAVQWSSVPTSWLDNLHRALDEAVAAAYGWPADLSDEKVLARLLALNLTRTSSRRFTTR